MSMFLVVVASFVYCLYILISSSLIGCKILLFFRLSSMPLIAFNVSMVLCCFLVDSIEHAVCFNSSINYSIWFEDDERHDRRGFEGRLSVFLRDWSKEARARLLTVCGKLLVDWYFCWIRGYSVSVLKSSMEDDYLESQQIKGSVGMVASKILGVVICYSGFFVKSQLLFASLLVVLGYSLT